MTDGVAIIEDPILAWNEETLYGIDCDRLRFTTQYERTSLARIPEPTITLDIGRGGVYSSEVETNHLHAVWRATDDLWLICVPAWLPDGLLAYAPTCLGVEAMFAQRMWLL